MAFLEEESEDVLAFNKGYPQQNVGTPFIGVQKANATDYSEYFPHTQGKKLGILTDENNTPIQKIQDIKDNGLDIVTATGTYIANIANDEKLEGTGAVLAGANPKASCKRIKQIKGGSSDGTYTINPAGTPFKVYCDMTTDGGGWTYATMLADNTTKNLFKTNNTDKITSLTKNISSKGQITDMWKDSNDKDIFLKCFVNNLDLKSYEIPLIIYDYKKIDISNLEKNIKQGTTFSSELLNAKYNGNKFILKNTYGVSSDDNSMYILDNINSKYVFWLGDSYSISVRTTGFLKSGAYNSSNINVSLDLKNYCLTAIR